MKRDIATTELFRRLGEEAPDIKVRWSSYLSDNLDNVIHAELTVNSCGLYFTNTEGVRAYGKHKKACDLHKNEYVQRYSVTRTLLGCGLFLETFI